MFADLSAVTATCKERTRTSRSDIVSTRGREIPVGAEARTWQSATRTRGTGTAGGGTGGGTLALCAIVVAAARCRTPGCSKARLGWHATLHNRAESITPSDWRRLAHRADDVINPRRCPEASGAADCLALDAALLVASWSGTAQLAATVHALGAVWSLLARAPVHLSRHPHPAVAGTPAASPRRWRPVGAAATRRLAQGTVGCCLC